MKRMFREALAVMLLFGVLTGCSGGTRLDPNAIETTLTTDPAPAAAGSPVKLTVALTGVSSAERVSVSFDIRSGDRTELIDATKDSDERYTVTYTFPEKGVYDVYLHLYIDDLHLTKKRQVEAQ